MVRVINDVSCDVQGIERTVRSEIEKSSFQIYYFQKIFLLSFDKLIKYPFNSFGQNIGCYNDFVLKLGEVFPKTLDAYWQVFRRNSDMWSGTILLEKKLNPNFDDLSLEELDSFLAKQYVDVLESFALAKVEKIVEVDIDGNFVDGPSESLSYNSINDDLDLKLVGVDENYNVGMPAYILENKRSGKQHRTTKYPSRLYLDNIVNVLEEIIIDYPIISEHIFQDENGNEVRSIYDLSSEKFPYLKLL